MYLKSRFWSVAYPYFLCSFVCGAIELAMSKFVNSPITFVDIIAIPVIPIEQFWFLYVLILCQIAAVLAYPSVWMMCGGVILGFIVRESDIPLVILSLFVAYLPYLAGGVMFSSTLRRLARSNHIVQLAIWVISVLCFVLTFHLGNSNVVLGYVRGGSGIMAVAAMSMLLAKWTVVAPLVRLGQASMAIYVLHTLFSAGARVILTLGGMERHSSTMLAMTTLAGLLLPLPFWYWSRQRKFSHMLGFGDSPALQKRRIRTSAPPNYEYNAKTEH
jgi:hypothetical protein